MSLQLAKSEPSLARDSPARSGVLDQPEGIKVLMPYDGSESAEMALEDLKRAGLPHALDAMVAVTSVLLPLSPYEITRAVSARRMKVLSAGAASFAPALREHEEQRILSLEAVRRISSIFPRARVNTEAMQDTATVANEVLRKAKHWGAELIVVGANSSPSPNITDYAGPVLKLVREANCSVRISRSAKPVGNSPIRNIICTDGSASAVNVVEAVGNRVWPAGSEIRLVAVRKYGPRDSTRDSETMAMLDRAAQELRSKSLKVSIAIREGKPHDVLLQEAREFAPDCLFIDSHLGSLDTYERTEGRTLGKAAEALVLGANCSVEVVRTNIFNGPFAKPAA